MSKSEIAFAEEDRVGENPYFDLALRVTGVSLAEVSRHTGIHKTLLGRIRRGMYSSDDHRQLISGYFSAKYGKRISEETLFPTELKSSKSSIEYRSTSPADEDFVSLSDAESHQMYYSEINGRSVGDNMQADIEEKIYHALSKLSPRDQRILKMRFGLNGQSYTLPELAEYEGVTKQRIKAIQKRALTRLRNQSGICGNAAPYME